MTQIIGADYIPEPFDEDEDAVGKTFTVAIKPGRSDEADQVLTASLRGNWQIGRRGGIYMIAGIIAICGAVFAFTPKPEPISFSQVGLCFAGETEQTFSADAFEDCLGWRRAR